MLLVLVMYRHWCTNYTDVVDDGIAALTGGAVIMRLLVWPYNSIWGHRLSAPEGRLSVMSQQTFIV